MKYYIIRKAVVHVGEQEADQIVSIVNKEKIAKDICRRYPNLFYECLKTGKGKYLYSK